jgi:hypothetical protein
MSKQPAKTWFVIYYFVDGKNKRYFCKDSGEWRHAETCGAPTFELVSRNEAQGTHTVKCSRGHQQDVIEGYLTQPKQGDGLF